jgi:uncharacterized protein YbjT (DUF2867 family)
MDKKIIAVVGATGAQGGGLVRAILADKTGAFAVRALTRKPDGEKGRELARLGAQVVAADADDPASLRKAFTGAHGVFCVTAFWEHFSPDKEKAQAAAMAKAAKDAGVRHAIWSTLEDTRKFVAAADPKIPTLMGRYKVPHFDAKAEADASFRDAGVPTTFLQTSFYWDNLIHFGMGPKKGADGRYAFVLPMGAKKLAGIAVDDIGRCALGILRGGATWAGKTVGIAGEHLTGAEMAATLTRVLGVPVAYQDVPTEVYRTFGFPGADDLANMFQFNQSFEREALAARDLKVSRALNPSLQTFATWLAANKTRIPLG